MDESNKESNSLSPGAKAGAGGAGVAGVLGVGFLIGKGMWVFVVMVVALLLVLLGGYLLFQAWSRKRQSRQFNGELRQHGTASPRSISDPGQRARLDDLRKKFEQGMEAYRSRGKDIYKLPWFVIVGEPGSGKTEAIRHCNVGFPPGMQDEFQGVGGTINMNWWFTNHSVLLDTAGRLMFEEVKPGDTSEWKEFLNLLKKVRPNCPVNGLLLVIPSDSLIRDTADEIQKKAGKIAQQLDVIQRTLDVRFPVCVLITKADKILGFREFFDNLTDPQLQHQILGWSNPEPLDAPFRPELVDQHIEHISQRLRRRRLNLLRDPVPEQDHPEARRLDEVDTLYALPNSLHVIASRLRRYLETIFVAGEWSAKPLFLRGIYFSSSMREGSALDQELAEVMGVPVDELGDFKVWERDRAYFLRDLFLEKVFRERGLVTRASDTKRMLLKRKLLLYGCGFLTLSLFITFAWLGMRSLKASGSTQSDYWRAAADVGWDARIWKHPIIPINNVGVYEGRVTSEKVPVKGTKLTLGEWHTQLRDIATNQLKSTWLFPAVVSDYNQKSLKAQRIVFESGVVKPLVEAARQKMRNETVLTGVPARLQADALGALIQLESAILGRGRGTNTGILDEAGARAFASPLLTYVAGADAKLDTNLASVMAWVYSQGAGRGEWPPSWLTGKTNEVPWLTNHVTLAAGLNVLARSVTNSLSSGRGDWDAVLKFQAAVLDFEQREKQLWQATRGTDVTAASAALTAVLEARNKLVEAQRQASGNRLLAGGASLTNAFVAFRNVAAGDAASLLERVRQANQSALGQHTNVPLFLEISQRLDSLQGELNRTLASWLTASAYEELRRLDAEFLAKANDEAAFARRCALYREAAELGQKPIDDKWYPGLQGKTLLDFRGEAEKLRGRCAGYSGGFSNGLAGITGFFLNAAVQRQSAAFFANYLAKAKARLAEEAGFPLLRTGKTLTRENIAKFRDDTLDYIVNKDLPSPVFANPIVTGSAEWRAFGRACSNLLGMAQAILGANNQVGEVTVSLADLKEDKDAKWRDGSVRWVQLRENPKLERPDRDGGELGKLPLDQSVQVKFGVQPELNPNPTHAQETGPWGALILIRDRGTRNPANPAEWLVDWPLAPNAPYQGSLRLKLQFKPSVDIQNWMDKLP